MRALRQPALAVLTGLVVLFALGCGGRLKPKGRMVRGGEPLRTGPGEGMRVVFEPVEVTGSTYDSYPAQFNGDDGTFIVTGKDGNGLPPGKYRVSIQLMRKKEDVFRGVLLGKKSPFTFDVESGSEELVIDLDKAQLGKKE
jgi:hypothetical protein